MQGEGSHKCSCAEMYPYGNIMQRFATCCSCIGCSDRGARPEQEALRLRRWVVCIYFPIIVLERKHSRSRYCQSRLHLRARRSQNPALRQGRVSAAHMLYRLTSSKRLLWSNLIISSSVARGFYIMHLNTNEDKIFWVRFQSLYARLPYLADRQTAMNAVRPLPVW